MRREVWPYLLGHYRFGDTPEQRRATDADAAARYREATAGWEGLVARGDGGDPYNNTDLVFSEQVGIVA